MFDQERMKKPGRQREERRVERRGGKGSAEKRGWGQGNGNGVFSASG